MDENKSAPLGDIKIDPDDMLAYFPTDGTQEYSVSIDDERGERIVKWEQARRLVMHGDQVIRIMELEHQMEYAAGTYVIRLIVKGDEQADDSEPVETTFTLSEKQAHAANNGLINRRLNRLMELGKDIERIARLAPLIEKQRTELEAKKIGLASLVESLESEKTALEDKRRELEGLSESIRAACDKESRSQADAVQKLLGGLDACIRQASEKERTFDGAIALLEKKEKAQLAAFEAEKQTMFIGFGDEAKKIFDEIKVIASETDAGGETAHRASLERNEQESIRFMSRLRLEVAHRLGHIAEEMRDHFGNSIALETQSVGLERKLTEETRRAGEINSKAEQSLAAAEKARLETEHLLGEAQNLAAQSKVQKAAIQSAVPERSEKPIEPELPPVETTATEVHTPRRTIRWQERLAWLKKPALGFAMAAFAIGGAYWFVAQGIMPLLRH